MAIKGRRSGGIGIYCEKEGRNAMEVGWKID